jgi:hypothetical protein
MKGKNKGFLDLFLIIFFAHPSPELVFACRLSIVNLGILYPAKKLS